MPSGETTKVDPSYDDLPKDRYHFPRTYLNAVRKALALVPMRGRSFPHHLISPNTSSTARTLNSPGSKPSPIHSFMCSWSRAFGSFRASSIS